MREPALLSRRALAAIPLAALAIAPTAAMPAITTASDDAALLHLGRRWQAALAAELAHGRAYSEAMSETEALAHEAVGDELHETEATLFDRIVRTPALTPAGLAVKARVLAYENDVEDLDEASIAAAFGSAHYSVDRAALSLALDVLRLARVTS